MDHPERAQWRRAVASMFLSGFSSCYVACGAAAAALSDGVMVLNGLACRPGPCRMSLRALGGGRKVEDTVGRSRLWVIK